MKEGFIAVPPCDRAARRALAIYAPRTERRAIAELARQTEARTQTARKFSDTAKMGIQNRDSSPRRRRGVRSFMPRWKLVPLKAMAALPLRQQAQMGNRMTFGTCSLEGGGLLAGLRARGESLLSAIGYQAACQIESANGFCPTRALITIATRAY